MTKEEIKKMLKDSAINKGNPDDTELIIIHIDRMADKIFKNLPQSDVILSLPSEEEINKISYQHLSDVATTTNSERKIEKAMWSNGADWMKQEIINLIKKNKIHN